MNPKKLQALQAKPRMVKRAELIQQLISTIPKENTEREGLKETPYRIAAMYDELFHGYLLDGAQVLRDAVFCDENCEDLILVKDIPFYSTCEHHMMPFFGTIAIAYIPQDGRIVGLSKLGRLAEIYARRLQVQERLGQQIAEALRVVLNPRGIAVIIKAEHLCMSARGVQKAGTQTVTSCLKGSFIMDEKARQELMSHL